MLGHGILYVEITVLPEGLVRQSRPVITDLLQRAELALESPPRPLKTQIKFIGIK